MLFQSKGYRLHELAEASTSSGIYAWYYRIELPDYDIEQCITDVNNCKPEDKSEMIRQFLDERLFRYFREAPYDIQIFGKMKPSYKGKAEHLPNISDDLVRRLTLKPERLRQLKSLLLNAVPFFASPIYIGVATNLRKRLEKHKHLIHKYSPAGGFDIYSPEQPNDPNDIADHSFAMEVGKSRNFTSEYLIAFTMEFELEENLHVDLENILNRINYPLCGRN